MTDREFARLLRRCGLAASTLARLQDEVSAAFQDRYGEIYSAVDADEIIDWLDYGRSSALRLADVDRIMSECGHPKVQR